LVSLDTRLRSQKAIAKMSLKSLTQLYIRPLISKENAWGAKNNQKPGTGVKKISGLGTPNQGASISSLDETL